MNKEPETYEELIRYKRCVDLTSHYELSKDELEKIYLFLSTYPKAVIIGNDSTLTLKVNYQPEIQPEIINSKCIDSSIDGLTLSNESLSLIPHYVPSSYSGYSGGSSSNKNNNNNNNNNNNR